MGNGSFRGGAENVWGRRGGCGGGGDAPGGRYAGSDGGVQG